MRPAQRAAHQRALRFVKTKRRQRRRGPGAIQPSERRFFTEGRGQGIDAEAMPGAAAQPQREPAVLRYAPLGDIQPGQDLDAGEQGVVQAAAEAGDFTQGAVDPATRPRAFGERLDVQVRRVAGNGAGDKFVERANGAGVFAPRSCPHGGERPGPGGIGRTDAAGGCVGSVVLHLRKGNACISQHMPGAV
jgi:hypothetical protein